MMSKVCNKSWLQIDDSGERTTYVFKPNNQLHLTINGFSQIIRWSFFPENERLVIYFFDKGGVSFHLKSFDYDVLLFLKADTGDIIILANEGNKNAPKSLDSLNQYLIERNASLIRASLGDNQVSRKIYNAEYTTRVGNTVDNVLSGCNDNLLIENIDYCIKNVSGFEFFYRNYLRAYQSRFDKDYFWYLVISSNANSGNSLKSAPHFNEIRCLDKYIVLKGEAIPYIKYPEDVVREYIEKLRG